MQYAIDVVSIPFLKAAHIHQGAKGGRKLVAPFPVID